MRCRRRARARRSRPASSSSATTTKPARPGICPQPEVLSRNGSYMAYRRLEEHVGGFREFLQRERQDARGAGAGRGEAHGPLAQRRAARARPRARRSGARRRPAAQQRLQLQGTGSARLRRAARLAHPAHEPARHRREHEPAADDPPRRDLRPGASRGRARGRQSSAASPRSSSARAWSASSSSRRTCGPTTRTSTSSGNERDPIIGTQDGTLEFKIPEATDPQDDQRASRRSPRCAAAPTSSCPGSPRCAGSLLAASAPLNTAHGRDGAQENT